MDAALQKRIQRYGWDKASAFYEAYWQEQLRPAQDKLLQMAAARRGEKIMDIACGTGLVSFAAAAQVGPEGSVYANDISERMIEECRRIAQSTHANNISFERKDAEDLGNEVANVDLALCALGLMYFPDPLKALKEMYRVIKPGGRLAVAVWGQRSNCGWADIFEIVDRRVQSEVCPLFFHLGNGNLLQKHLALAGFSNIEIARIKTSLTYSSDEDACGAAFSGGPVALAYNKFTDDVKQEVHREYLQSIAAYKQDGIYAIPGEFVIASAIRAN